MFFSHHQTQVQGNKNGKKKKKKKNISKLIIWYQIKGPIIIVHLKVYTVKLKCFDYKIFSKNMICLF